MSASVLRRQAAATTTRLSPFTRPRMRILGVTPGRVVGRAWNFLLELRLNRGPIGRDEAIQALLDWAAEEGIPVPEPADDEPAGDEPGEDEPADDEPADDEPADDEPAGD